MYIGNLITCIKLFIHSIIIVIALDYNFYYFNENIFLAYGNTL